MNPSPSLVGALALVVSLAACGDDGSLNNRGVGAVCSIDRDCAAGLVCDLGDEISTCQPRDAGVQADAGR